jgi:hypothetical protein
VATLTRTPITCKRCGKPISSQRLLALPLTDICIDCRKDDDVSPIIGYMSWSHKTAPQLLTSLEEGEQNIRELHRYSRKGVHASLPLSSPRNPFVVASVRTTEGHAEFDSIRTEDGDDASLERVADLLPATCHPTEPRVTPDGKCLTCALDWYRVRQR